MSDNTIRSGLGTRIQSNPRSDSADHNMAKAVDELYLIKKYRKHFDKMFKGTLTFPRFMQEVAPDMAMGLLQTLDKENVSERLKTQIRLEFLDRAGYGKIQKNINLNPVIDPETSKRELIALILTKSKAAGLQIDRGGKDAKDYYDISPFESSMSDERKEKNVTPPEVFTEKPEPDPNDSDNEGVDV